jgi:predicted NBD/HSP70 family sugar kinase/phosphoglycolate phosphatase-like HAD superfamily hydrolase
VLTARTRVVLLDLDNTVWYGGQQRHGYLFSEMVYRFEHELSLDQPLDLTLESFLSGWERYTDLLHLTAPEQLELLLTQLAEKGHIDPNGARELYPQCARWLDERYVHYVHNPHELLIAGPRYEHGRAVRMVPGAERAIEELRRSRRDGAGPHVVALTLNLEGLSTYVLDHLGILDVFDEVLGAEWGRPTIPKAERVRAVAARLELPTSQALVVGDSAGDILCARSAGAVSLAIATGPTPAEQLLAACPDELIEAWPSDPGELRQLLGIDSQWSIGIDVGGTKTRAALVDARGRVVSSVHTTTTPSVRTHPGRDVGELQRALVEHVAAAYQTIRAETGAEVSRCAVSFAGVVVDRRSVVKAADLLGIWGTWESEGEIESPVGTRDVFPLGQLLEERTGTRWLVENDLIAALWRYARRPQYRQVRSMCLLTVSTGIGYAVLDRSAPLGAQMRLVSLGHQTVDRSSDAIACDCGGSGHLTSYASGKGVERRLREAAEADEAGFMRSSLGAGGRRSTASLENADLVAAVRAGDDFALRVLYRSVDRLAAGVSAMLEREPRLERVILSGGFLHATAVACLPRLMQTLATAHGLHPLRLERLFVSGEPDDLDGVIGAAMLAAAPL